MGDQNKVGDLLLEDFKKEHELLMQQINHHRTLLRSAVGSKASRELFSGFNGVLLVYERKSGEQERCVIETMQPFLALEAYYEIDCGKIHSRFNDEMRKL